MPPACSGMAAEPAAAQPWPGWGSLFCCVTARSGVGCRAFLQGWAVASNGNGELFPSPVSFHLCAGGTNSVKMCKMCSAQAFPLLDMLLRHLVHGCVWKWPQSGQHGVLGYRVCKDRSSGTAEKAGSSSLEWDRMADGSVELFGLMG